MITFVEWIWTCLGKPLVGVLGLVSSLSFDPSLLACSESSRSIAIPTDFSRTIVCVDWLQFVVANLLVVVRHLLVLVRQLELFLAVVEKRL